MHSVTLTGEWHKLGSLATRLTLNLIPRLGLSRSLIRTQRHFLLLSNTCLSPLQQSRVGALASSLTYGRHVAKPTSWSAHSALSCWKSDFAEPTSINSTKIYEIAEVVTPFFEPISGWDREQGVYGLQRKERTPQKIKFSCFTSQYKGCEKKSVLVWGQEIIMTSYFNCYVAGWIFF